MKPNVKIRYSKAKVAASVTRLGKAISREYKGQTIDVVAIMDNAVMFAADLIRHITCPVVCHFVRADIRDVVVGGYQRKEIFFSPEPVLKGRHILLVDALLHTGVTLDFWAKRLQESKPRSLKVAVLLDKPLERKVALKPDYACFETASKYLVGYGLPGPTGELRNLPYVGTLGNKRNESKRRAAGRSGRRRK